MFHFDDFLGRVHGNISVTFILEMPVVALMDVFKDSRFSRPPMGQTQKIGQDLMIGPPEMPIAVYKQTRISYIGERFRLQIVGPIADLIELVEIIPSLFEKDKFSIQNATRYVEFSMPFTPFEFGNAIGAIRSKVHVKGIESLNEICGCKMEPFKLSLANLDSPLSDEWFHITLQPDVNRTHDILLIEIIKRTRGLDDMKSFLNSLGRIIQGIKGMLTHE
jgi:hypothetical protein